jgi:hypothetical protein
MNQDVAEMLLSITETMLAMAKENHWQEFAEQEKNRAKIIADIKAQYGESFTGHDEHTISVLEKIIAINQTIHELSLKQLNADKHAILSLNKSQKLSSAYQAR